jgi:methionyl aminopeptidase
MRVLPTDIAAPPYAAKGDVPSAYPKATVHDSTGQKRMREACAAARDVLAYACSIVTPGMTTDDIDRLVHEKCIAMRVYPSPLNYAHFPKSVCTSINEVVCHGIPDMDAVIVEGDIVKLDVSTYIGGVHGDTCRSVVAGDLKKADPSVVKLMEVTKECLNAAIAICGPGVPIRQIGSTIQQITEKHGYGIIRNFAGHGIGSTFHTEPLVYHMVNSSSAIMQPGMTFTIEPMLSEGSPDLVMWPDNWTVVTADGSRAAQFEHTLLVTESGVDVLTKYD